MLEQLLLGKREAARALGISVRTLEHLISAREISVRRVGRRVLNSRDVLASFIRRDHPTRVMGDPLQSQKQ